MPKKSSLTPSISRDRRKRASPSARPALVITERDHKMIHAIQENRFLTRSLLFALFPPDPDKTPAHLPREATTASGTNLDRRLAKLFHNNYLDRVRTAPGTDFVYALAKNGAELLKTRNPDLSIKGDWAEKNRTVTDDYIEHAIMIARFRTALELAIPHVPDLTLAHFFREVHLPLEKSHPDQPYIPHPDAFFRLQTPRGTASFFLEADCSSMPHRKMLPKFKRYVEMYQRRLHTKHFDGIKNFRVLITTKSKERAFNLLDIVSGHITPGHHRLFYFITEATYSDAHTNILAARWRAADRPNEPSAIVPSPLKAK